MDTLNKILLKRLRKKGMRPITIPGFIRDVTNVNSDKQPDIREISRRLTALGWDEFEMDDHTLQLVLAIVDSKSLLAAKPKPVLPH